MSFEADGIVFQFIRGYTTSGGHSVIASATTVVKYILNFNADVVIGNFAVLHWQQNSEPVHKWEAQLRSACVGWTPTKPTLAFYLGPTQIQLGRTQGLQPARTRLFARAAQRILGQCGFQYIEVHNLTASRRESSFDGQHWACYHTYGGVSHTILQVFLNRLC